MVQLTSEQQTMFMRAAPRTFMPVPGGSGRLKPTNVVLVCANEEIVESALVVTAARRMEAAAMTWGELNGEWTLPASRNVTKVDMVRPLSAEARAVLPAQVDGCDYVFTEGRKPISNFSARQGDP